MKTLCILIGLQASGKSTFARSVLKDFNRINLDELKTRRRESIQYETLLGESKNFVIDNTNPSKADRQRYIPQAKALGYRIIGYYFESKVSDCQKRNAMRMGKEQVPTLAIAGTSKKLQLPSLDEGFDELFYVKLNKDGFDIRTWEKEPAIPTFSELSKAMKRYEKESDWVIDRRNYVVVRLDGRNFSRLTKETIDFEAPFDERFHSMMLKTLEALIESGFRIAFAYTQSDEISLLLDNRQDMFGRRSRKILSILAGTASAAFSLQLGQMAVFDSRLLSLPNAEAVKQYFLWRFMDSKRNCLNAYAYWSLRNKGMSAIYATTELLGKSTSWKLSMLDREGISIVTLPAWQKTGTMFRYEARMKTTVDQKSGEVKTLPKQVKRTTDGIGTQEEFIENIESALNDIEETVRQKEKLWGRAY